VRTIDTWRHPEKIGELGDPGVRMEIENLEPSRPTVVSIYNPICSLFDEQPSLLRQARQASGDGRRGLTEPLIGVTER
jgi:hypothetical protein